MSCYKLADEYGQEESDFYPGAISKDSELYYYLTIEETKEAYDKSCKYGVADGCLKSR
jgi:hypothetical protein